MLADDNSLPALSKLLVRIKRSSRKIDYAHTMFYACNIGIRCRRYRHYVDGACEWFNNNEKANIDDGTSTCIKRNIRITAAGHDLAAPGAAS